MYEYVNSQEFILFWCQYWKFWCNSSLFFDDPFQKIHSWRTPASRNFSLDSTGFWIETNLVVLRLMIFWFKHSLLEALIYPLHLLNLSFPAPLVGVSCHELVAPGGVWWSWRMSTMANPTIHWLARLVGNEGMKLYMVMMGIYEPSFPTGRASQFIGIDL